MGKSHKDNQGFTHIGFVLFAMVVIVTIGGAGYYVVSKNKENSKTNRLTTQSSSSTSSSISTATQTSAPEFMEIKEFGIKVKLSDPINDAYYTIKTSSSGKKYAAISTRALAKKYPGCAAESDGYDGAQFGSINSFTDPNSPDPYAGNYTMKDTFPDAVNVNGTFYYLATDHQAPCDSSLLTQSGEVDMYNEVRDAFDTAKLEKL